MESGHRLIIAGLTCTIALNIYTAIKAIHGNLHWWQSAIPAMLSLFQGIVLIRTIRSLQKINRREQLSKELLDYNNLM